MVSTNSAQKLPIKSAETEHNNFMTFQFVDFISWFLGFLTGIAVFYAGLRVGLKLDIRPLTEAEKKKYGVD